MPAGLDYSTAPGACPSCCRSRGRARSGGLWVQLTVFRGKVYIAPSRGSAMTNPATMNAERAAAIPWDALVIGAGPAGALAAQRLARGGRRVLLVDAKTFPRDKVCGGCVNARALEVLHEAGLGHVLADVETVELREYVVHLGRRVVAFPFVGGIAVSRSAFDAALVRAAIAAGAEFLPGTAGRLVPRPRSGGVASEEQSSDLREVLLETNGAPAGRRPSSTGHRRRWARPPQLARHDRAARPHGPGRLDRTADAAAGCRRGLSARPIADGDRPRRLRGQRAIFRRHAQPGGRRRPGRFETGRHSRGADCRVARIGRHCSAVRIGCARLAGHRSAHALVPGGRGGSRVPRRRCGRLRRAVHRRWDQPRPRVGLRAGRCHPGCRARRGAAAGRGLEPPLPPRGRRPAAPTVRWRHCCIDPGPSRSAFASPPPVHRWPDWSPARSVSRRQ